MVNIICVFLCVIFKMAGACSSELFPDTLTPEAGVRLAHSEAYYDNVGMLHADSIMRGRATVTYIGGRTCLTAAHNFQSPRVYGPSFLSNLFLGFMYRYTACFKPNYRVGFDVNGQIVYCKVLDYSIHPDYADRKSHTDIAIVQLDREVEGLTGLPLCYDFGEKVENFQSAYEDITRENKGEHISYPLTYVGYGGERIGTLSELENMHNQRRACRSFLVSASNSLGTNLLLSAGHGVNLYLKNETDHESERRALLPYETGTSEGMSGGPVFYNGKVIAINSASAIHYVDPVYLKEMNFRWYANFCVQLANFFIPPLWWYPIPAYSVDKILFGMMEVSVPLGAHKKWIEDTKADFDMGVSKLSVSKLSARKFIKNNFLWAIFYFDNFR